MKKTLKLVWFGIRMAGWVALGGATLASAGTYNFYINNTEQGDNSNSTPTLTVKDGKDGQVEVEKNGVKEEAKKPGETNPNAFPASESPDSAPAITTNTSMARKNPDQPKQSPFRLTGGVGTANLYQRTARNPITADPTDPTPFWEQYDESSGSQSAYEISGEFYPHPLFGLGVIFGKLSGVEMMLAPLGLTGSAVQPEFTVGYLGTKSGFDGEADPFVGARLNLVVQENVALTATLRKSIETNPDLRYTQMIAGVSLRF